MSEIIKAILFGIVEGITEWLPVSSTGHMIILDELIKLNVSKEFLEVFLVVIQLGAILAVVMLYWNQLFPFSFKKGEDTIRKDVFSMWFKVIAACIPAAVVGILFDDQINELFYNYQTVATALIVFGILFIVIENKNQTKKARITSIAQITYRDAMLVGLFQLIAAIFPGTSRSGATILGGILIGLSRTTAAEFTFFLAVPVMAGASLLKILKFGLAFSGVRNDDPAGRYGSVICCIGSGDQISDELHKKARFQDFRLVPYRTWYPGDFVFYIPVILL